MSILEQIKEGVIAGNAKNVKEYTDRAVAEGLEVSVILNDGLIAGKNLVIMMLEGAGYKVIDLGVDVPVEKFIGVVEEQHPQIVGLSALLTTTMPQMQEAVGGLQPYRDRVKP